MKIALAQINSIKGNVTKNIALHRAAISLAIAKNAEAIFFPELSITGYEPELAKDLKIELNDPRLEVFQQTSDTHNIIIGIGAPLKMGKNVQIVMLFFQPNQPLQKYAKQILHEDELPYFVNGDKQIIIQQDVVRIAPGICYESLQIQHLENVLSMGANIYLASVAKSQKGIDKANAYFPKMAKEKSILILMSNNVGFCDNFMSAGQSAIWNKDGNLLGQLSIQETGILLYDTFKDSAMSLPLPLCIKKEINSTI